MFGEVVVDGGFGVFICEVLMLLFDVCFVGLWCWGLWFWWVGEG